MPVKPYMRKAQYYETDQMGIIHHSNYIRWFEEARVDFLEQIGFGYARVVAEGIDSPLLAVSCEYKAPVRFGEQIEIRCAVTALDGVRMAVGYRILGEDKSLRASGETRHCFTGRNGRPLSIRKALPALYALLLASIASDSAG